MATRVVFNVVRRDNGALEIRTGYVEGSATPITSYPVDVAEKVSTNLCDAMNAVTLLLSKYVFAADITREYSFALVGMPLRVDGLLESSDSYDEPKMSRNGNCAYVRVPEDQYLVLIDDTRRVYGSVVGPWPFTLATTATDQGATKRSCVTAALAGAAVGWAIGTD